jgi:hypothetical protein
MAVPVEAAELLPASLAIPTQAVEVEFHHRKQRMLARVRLAGNPTVEDTQDVDRIETFLGRFDALRFAVGVIVELIGGGNVYAVI